MSANPDAPQFPAGEFFAPGDYGLDDKARFVEGLRNAPAKIAEAVEGLDDEQLNTRYKNWSIRQIVHHLADSHMNAYIRFKWALTEASPLIKSYDETKWSELVDAQEMPIDASLMMLEGLHKRWAMMVEKLSEDDMECMFFHPEAGAEVMLKESLPTYVWHTDHHVAQIHWLRERMS